jgi:DNA-binding transcriptional LysR family regulator
LDLQQLENFRVVATNGNVTRAAALLGISQPSLSRAIQRLERDLGAALFEHQGRRTELTQYGRAFLPRVTRLLEEFAEGRREIADLLSADHGVISLGFLASLGADYAPHLVKRFRLTCPNVRFTLIQSWHSALLRKLEAGDIRLCLTVQFRDERYLEWVHLFDQEIVALVPLDHRLAGQKSVHLADLAEEAFVVYEAGSLFRILSDDLCAAAGFVPTVAFEAQDSGSIRGFVSAGLGLAIVPQTSLNVGVHALRILDRSAHRAIGIAWSRNHYLSLAERKFLEFVQADGPLGPSLP